MQERLDRLDEEKARVSLGGGQDKIEKQHERGKLTARERINLFFDVAEPTAQLGCNGGAGSQRTAFRGTGQHRPDERERESGARQRNDLAGG